MTFIRDVGETPVYFPKSIESVTTLPENPVDGTAVVYQNRFIVFYARINRWLDTKEVYSEFSAGNINANTGMDLNLSSSTNQSVPVGTNTPQEYALTAVFFGSRKISNNFTPLSSQEVRINGVTAFTVNAGLTNRDNLLHILKQPIIIQPNDIINVFIQASSVTQIVSPIAIVYFREVVV